MSNYKNIQKRLFNFDIYIVVLMILMPLLLVAFNSWEIRLSISNYAYAKNNQILPFLLGISGTMFAVKDSLQNKKFNIVLGLCLGGVALTPHLEFPVIHDVFAGLFFLGTTYKLFFYSEKKIRTYMRLAALLIIVGMLGHFAFKCYSLFWAESIALTPAALYYMSEYFEKCRRYE